MISTRTLFFTLYAASSLAALSYPGAVWLKPDICKNNEGLSLLWSADSVNWQPVGDSFIFLRSDFGPWTSEKKMYDPALSYDSGTGLWHCTWYGTAKRETLAHTSSADLVRWSPQTYKDAAEQERATQGAMKVSSETLENLESHVQARRYLDKRNRERLKDKEDALATFSGLKLTATPSGQKPYDISDNLIGIFFEDINYAADGGLYGELVQNRDFEYSSADRPEWTSLSFWKTEGDGGALEIKEDDPIHPNNPHYGYINVVSADDFRVINEGFDGIPVKKGESYDFSMWLKGNGMIVELCDPAGDTLCRESVYGGQGWQKVEARLQPEKDCDVATLRLVPAETGEYGIDMVSLFPSDTFKGRKNGLRKDLAEALEQLHPKFVRFPGGCVAHGNGIDNIYDWKGSVGPLEQRKGMPNLWGYHQSRGLGYLEYFLLCEDIGAMPLPVVAAGVPCQNSSAPCRYSHNELTTMGQQEGIPMDDMDDYIQDIFDLIEWANGDPETNKWARLRADSGHPEPFGLKYLGIGNEDMITPVFQERFEAIYNAVKTRYPEITVIGTVGPFYEGSDYEEGWKFARALDVPIVDEHYYVSPGWMLNNRDFYDRYERNGTKVYLGEYAVHNPERTNTMETVLIEALYLTDLERNGDVVVMASYAPLFLKENHWQWRPDMIYFDNNSVTLTPTYHVQKMFAENSGTEYVPLNATFSSINEEIRKRAGVSLVKDKEKGEMILKIVNAMPAGFDAEIDLHQWLQDPSEAKMTILQGELESQDSTPKSEDIVIQPDFSMNVPGYSFIVIRFKDESKDIGAIFPSEKPETCIPESLKKEQRFPVAELASAAGVFTFASLFVNVTPFVKARKYVQEHLSSHGMHKTTVDNYLQYAPAAAPYLLYACGYKGNHNLLDKTILLAMSASTFALLNISLKTAFHEKRPDTDAKNSFPSGHTGTAFMGAEFMRREYWNSNKFVAMSGYVVATAVGILRIHNDRHWINDVVGGSALGFFSTTFSYWLYSNIFQKRELKHLQKLPMMVPCVSTNSVGLSLAYSF